jgi:hypothetical protein
MGGGTCQFTTSQTRPYKTVRGRHTLKNISCLFQYIFFHPVPVFYHPSRSSYSKFILYINYHPYFNIFYTTNFFSHIPISTTIHFFYFYAELTYKFIIYYFILIYIIITFYFLYHITRDNIIY